MRLKLFTLCYLIAVLQLSCHSENTDIPATYTIEKEQIQFNGKPISVNGVNTLNTFGIANQELYSSWNISIVREFIGNLREQPVSGSAIQDSRGDYLHSLQAIVETNRSHGVITILCPFGWVNTQGQQMLFTGLNPSNQSFYLQYKEKMRAIAEQFKNQPDVWLEVWNEPYHYANANGYSHELWLADQIDMVDNLRSVQGFDNIILIPGNKQGQSETAILEKGQDLLNGRQNLLFDLHAYEHWLLNHSAADISSRINQIKTSGFAFIFGEVGVINTSGLMSVHGFLSAVKSTQTPTLAWLFNRNTNDQNALLTNEGLPNNTNNNDWGTTYMNFLNSFMN